ncbi:hypothetical protein [Winogradskyella sp.]|uniref:hypothetical protein n=1 Tax=Winogradskyella sp. TaxID=1883156 RepID=UPI00263899B3|nr:hypothetical protein [Winogradskyella sp.]
MKIKIHKLLLLISIVYTIVGMYFMLSQPIGAGDEGLFIADIHYLKQYGRLESIKKGISIPHTILVYPLSVIMEPYLALRTINIVLLIALYFYFFYRNNPSILFFFYLTFFTGTCKVFFIGTNDSLFILCLAIFLNEVHRFNIGKSWNQSLALSVLIVGLFTRALIIMYLPALLLCFLFVYRIKGFNRKGFFIPILITMLLLILNLPAIQTNGKLSYDKKNPPEDVSVTWAQRQYLAQLMVNEGKLQNYQHPSFEATQNYVDENGEDALPKTLFSGIVFNPKLTLIEFFKDGLDIFIFGTRQLGLILIIVLGMLLSNLFRKKFLDFENIIPLALLITILVFSLVIISYVELRWFVPIFIGAIVFYTFLEDTKRIGGKVSKVNLAVIFLLMSYGLIKIIPKL